MSCIALYKGQDNACKTFAKKYYQQVVLINKKHIDSFDINIGISMTGEPDAIKYNRVRFRLKEGRSGILFRGNERGDSYQASFEMDREDNIPQYLHNVQLPVFGVDEETKILLKTLDTANYFAAIQYRDNTVEIYGFENGLMTDPYSYEPSENEGGSIINLISSDNGLEDDPPYIYIPLPGRSANDDFNNLFQDIPVIILGSFNDDFNDDFDIT